MSRRSCACAISSTISWRGRSTPERRASSFPAARIRTSWRTPSAAAKFPPLGHRGFGLGPAQIGYQAASFDEITAHCNSETLLVAQVESTRALQGVNELASVEGLNSLLIGPADLSISLGVGGQWTHPRLVDAVDNVIAACTDHGLWPAIQVRDGRLAEFWIGRGMKLIGCSTEATLLWGAVQGLTGQLRTSAGQA